MASTFGKLKSLKELREEAAFKEAERAEERLIKRFDVYKGNPALFFEEQLENQPLPWQAEELNKAVKMPLYCLSVARQNGKSEVLRFLYLYFVFVEGRRVFHSAHRGATSDAMYDKIIADVRVNPNLQEMVTKNLSKSGGQIIRVRNGGMINFATRTRSAGLGLTYDILGIDEAQELTNEQFNAIKPTITTSEDPRILLTGTPPTQFSVGDVWETLKRSNPEVFSHYGISKYSKKIDDPKLWREGMPSLGYLFTEEDVQGMVASTVDVLDFNIQFLGWWPDNSLKRSFSASIWEKGKITGNEARDRFGSKAYSVGVKSDDNNARVSVVVAFEDNNQYYIQGVDSRPLSEGIAWVEEFLSSRKNLVNVWVDGSIRNQVSRFGVKDTKAVTTREFFSSTFELQQVFDEGRLVHTNQPALTQSFLNATQRKWGKSGSFGYSSLVESVSANMVEAAALAIGACAASTGYRDRQGISI